MDTRGAPGAPLRMPLRYATGRAAEGREGSRLRTVSHSAAVTVGVFLIPTDHREALLLRLNARADRRNDEGWVYPMTV
jgi:hypothetical protein